MFTKNLRYFGQILKLSVKFSKESTKIVSLLKTGNKVVEVGWVPSGKQTGYHYLTDNSIASTMVCPNFKNGPKNGLHLILEHSENGSCALLNIVAGPRWV
jgi:hypothetical protein